MAFLFWIKRMIQRRQIVWAVQRLDHPDETVRRNAEQDLRNYSPDCWPALRRAAFRQGSRLAVLSAELLYSLGDMQGLYALLEQFSDWHMYSLYGAHMRRTLQQIGADKVLSALEMALDQIETPPFAREHWCLSLSVYALHALRSLQAPIPRSTWARAITVYVPDFEDLRLCRTVLPVAPTGEARQTSVPLLEEWRVGSTLAAVRRIAVDALLTLEPDRAFELLREALSSGEPQIQLTALYGLCRLRDRRAYVLLQPIAANRRHPLARDARRVIEALGPGQPDVLTLVRASQVDAVRPEEMLRPAAEHNAAAPNTLLRPTVERQTGP